MKLGTEKLCVTALVGTLLWGCGDGADNSTQTQGPVGGQGGSNGTSTDYASSSDDDWLWGSYDDEEEEDADAGAKPTLPPFSHPFQALVKNQAMWSTFQVAVKGARVERGMDEVVER